MSRDEMFVWLQQHGLGRIVKASQGHPLTWESSSSRRKSSSKVASADPQQEGGDDDELQVEDKETQTSGRKTQ